MYQTSQLGALVLGIISLATTFSYAAPSVSLSRVDQNQLDTLPRVPYLNEEDDRAVYGGQPNLISDDLNVFDKRKTSSRTFWAVASRTGWNIKVTRQFKFQKDKWIGELTKSGNTLGQGGQGTVIDGSWQVFDDPTTDLTKAGFCESVPVPVAIKISEGDQGYEYAKLLARVDSEYVVKPQIWAKTPTAGKVESIVAFEELTENVQQLRDRGGQPDFRSLLKALFQGSIAAKKQGLFNMDIKLKNIMTLEYVGAPTIWKIIDWDMLVYKDRKDEDPEEPGTGYMGSFGYMPPEMVAYLLDKRTTKSWTAEKAVVWDIGMTLLYSQGIGEYEGTVTPEMKQLAKKIYSNNKRRPPSSKNEKWMWIALLSALSESKSVLEAGENILPTQLQSGKSLSKYRSWFAKVLCKEDDRYNLEDAWDALVALDVGLN
ncbi:hypothetical protein N7510_004376 [Penicillium lagena]|uniref:uncharacterized protein n=1 Tax=Penicillium lagena TaxID=94218 RepID=UPI00254249CF|nr:uncharacterized protein N7510_004376 [Penicillium lagena]KAJ5620392.1 hypothetical protein N7510_004376 [Penicillium lagena]